MRGVGGRGLASACGALLLSGCALGERVYKPDVTLPSAFEAPQAEGGASAAALDQWWLLFEDAQLTRLVTLALKSSPDAKTALFRLQEARADRDEEVAAILPKGDVTASAADQYERQSFAHINGGLPQAIVPFLTPANGSSQTYSAGWNVSWELDLYGGDLTAVRTANAGLAAARFAYEASRFALAAEVATDLFQARGVAVQLQNARETLRLARNLSEASRRKAEAGLATTADAARTLADAESDEAQVAALEAQLRGAERALLVLVGRGSAPSSELVIAPEVAPPPAVPRTAPGALLVRRPDVREAQENLVEASGQLKLDKLQLFPSLTIQPGLAASRQVLSFYTLDSQSASGGLSLKVPVLSLPSLLAEVRAQGARGRQAAAAYEKAVQSAYGDAERSLTSLEADARRVKLLEDATRRSRFAYDAANRGYALGLADLTSVVQAEQGWRLALSSYTLAEVDALVDTVAAFKALGGGWPAAPQVKSQ